MQLLTILNYTKKNHKQRTTNNLTLCQRYCQDSQTDGHQQFYSTLENTAHSYQIVQGDLGKLLLQKFTQATILF
jgi:DNA polymerase-1